MSIYETTRPQTYAEFRDHAGDIGITLPETEGGIMPTVLRGYQILMADLERVNQVPAALTMKVRKSDAEPELAEEFRQILWDYGMHINLHGGAVVVEGCSLTEIDSGVDWPELDTLRLKFVPRKREVQKC